MVTHGALQPAMAIAIAKNDVMAVRKVVFLPEASPS
jgi:hypothetical protein